MSERSVVPGGPEHRARIIRGIREWCETQRQVLADIDHWNRRNPHEEPIDYPDIREMLADAEAMLTRDPGHGPIAPFQFRIVSQPRGVQ